MAVCKNATIATGQANSNEIQLQNEDQILGLFFPAAFTGTALSFLASSTPGGTFVDVYDVAGASVYSLTVGVSRYVPVDPRIFVGINYIKLKAGTNQAADVVVQVACRDIA